MKTLDVSFTHENKHIEAKIYGDRSKPAVLLLPGAGDAFEVYEEIFEKLHENFCIYCINPPGIGSSSGKIPTRATSYLEILNRFVKENIKEEFRILGYSLGASIGILYANTFNLKLKSMLLFAPSLAMKHGSIVGELLDAITSQRYSQKLKTKNSPHILHPELLKENLLERRRFFLLNKSVLKLINSFKKVILPPTKIIISDDDTLVDNAKAYQLTSQDCVKIIRKDIHAHSLFKLLPVEEWIKYL